MNFVKYIQDIYQKIQSTIIMEFDLSDFFIALRSIISRFNAGFKKKAQKLLT